MPSAAKMKQTDVKRRDGVSIEYGTTSSWRRGKTQRNIYIWFKWKKFEEYKSLSYRDALALDIKNASRIYMKDGVYTSEIRNGLQNVSKINKEIYS